jgi:hypothetical protein
MNSHPLAIALPFTTAAMKHLLKRFLHHFLATATLLSAVTFAILLP